MIMRLLSVRFFILATLLFLLSANPGVSDTPVQQELLKGFVHPPVNFSPGRESDSEARKYQGIPTIERAPGGRLWAAWYAGPIREEKFNYVVVATSADDGKTWSDLKLVINPDGTGPLRASDPCLWLDPTGRLWLFWWMNGNFEGNEVHVTMAISTENPDAENPVWSEPKAQFPGVMLNKPIVVKNGEWLMPAAIWHREESCRMMVSKDGGKTWALRGTANVPEARRQCDEPMVVERKDGSLWQLVRTAEYGLGETVSTDGGRTWTEVADYLYNATSRFHLRKLQSGNLLLIKHGPLDERIGRKDLTAYLSIDDGATWKGGLLMDERNTVSYPDATQAPDGTIYAIYDWNRADEKNILMTTFTEQDVLAGGYVSDKARSKVLINHATGINPKPWLKKADAAAGLRTDADAAPFEPGPGATLAAGEGGFQPLEIGATLFSNRGYTLYSLPDALAGMQFLFSSIDRTSATCLKPGRVYVLTPAKDRNPDSVDDELLAQGFEKTSMKEFFLFTMKGQTRFPNACFVYQKQVQTGEKIRFGKWGVLVGMGGNTKPAFLNPPQVLTGLSSAYVLISRRFQGIPSLAVAPGGRLWATWYAGKTKGEDQNNYVVVSSSGDNGKTWAERRIIDPDGIGPVRAFDPELWVDPDGKLWAFWTQSIGHDGTVAGVWAMTTDHPDAENPAWSDPVRLTDGVMMCKPIVLSSGEWVLPSSTWRKTDSSARMVVSSDQGRSWEVRGACNVPKEVRSYDEHIIVERKDGSLWMLVRTNYGIGESVSKDRGATWPDLKPSAIPHPSARCFIRRLASGNLLLVKHGGIHEKTGRSHLTAFLSMDDGKTWEGGLLLDERSGVSYPDGMQAADGTIYIAYDRDRNGAMEILMSTFTEQDVLAGAHVSDKARAMVLISHATGINPKP